MPPAKKKRLADQIHSLLRYINPSLARSHPLSSSSFPVPPFCDCRRPKNNPKGG